VIATTRGVDALDRLVIALDLLTCLRGALAVVDHTHDRIHRTGDTLQRFAEYCRVILDARAEFGIHVLDRADPYAEHAGPQIAEVLPRQRVGAKGAACVRGRR